MGQYTGLSFGINSGAECYVCHRYELSVVELFHDSGLVHWHIADIPINTLHFYC